MVDINDHSRCMAIKEHREYTVYYTGYSSPYKSKSCSYGVCCVLSIRNFTLQKVFFYHYSPFVLSHLYGDCILYTRFVRLMYIRLSMDCQIECLYVFSATVLASSISHCLCNVKDLFIGRSPYIGVSCHHIIPIDTRFPLYGRTLCVILQSNDT